MARKQLGAAPSVAQHAVPKSYADSLFSGAASSATVGTYGAESTTSTTYTDLATTTDTVTVTVKSSGLVLVGMTASATMSSAGAIAKCSFAISGANTAAASDQRSLFVQAYANYAQWRQSGAWLIPSLSTGSTTFKMKYRSDPSGSAMFWDRSIWAVPL